MPKFTFMGSNASGYVQYGGYRFETGKAVEVKDSDENADLIDRLNKNQEFKGSAKKADPAEELAAFDHDGDGKAGGSKAKAAKA